MSEQEEKANLNMNFWAKQNPMLYLLVILVMGGNGADLFTNNALRDDVHGISKQLDDALERIEDEERLSAMFRREIDILERRVSDIEDRLKRIEEEGSVEPPRPVRGPR